MDHELNKILASYPRPPEPLVEKNNFRHQIMTRQAIIPFHEAKGKLPVPLLPDFPEWVEMYWRAWEMAWSSLKRPTAANGFVANYIDPKFNKNIFMWDTAFMIQYGVYGRRAFDFANALDNFYAKQHEDGFICREITTAEGLDYFSPFDPDSTGPNILAWAEWQYYRHSGEEKRLVEVFWPLMAFHRWVRANRTWPSGLYWASGWSSGMDNQPRVPGGERHHQRWSWVDASMQATLDCAVLEKLADQFGQEELLAELGEERHALNQLINERLWNPETLFYHDIDPHGRFSKVKSIGAYWGLLDNELIPVERIKPFVQHLRDKGVFNIPHRVPSMSADSEGYDPKSGDYWRGAVWSPMNYMLLKGLRVAGKYSLAHKIAHNHLENVAAVYLHTDTFWENYAPESAAPGDPARPNFVGSTGLSPIAILLEDMIGIWVDWPLRRVYWTRFLKTDRPYGVENYPLGPDGTLKLTGDHEKIVVSTDVPFTLTIKDESLNLQVPVPIGTTEIELT